MRSKDRSAIARQLKLYLVFEENMLRTPLEHFVSDCVRGGVTAFQIRCKDNTARHKYETAVKVSEMLKDTDVLLCINDCIDTAVLTNAPCVHLGVKDIPLKEAKKIKPDIIYGYSCNSLADIEYANEHGASYIGTGPAFGTVTKKDLRPVIGREGIAEIVSAADVPAVAIGGINEANISELSGIGLAGCAVSSALCASETPYETTSKLRDLCEKL